MPWICKECGSEKIGVREDIMQSTSYLVTVKKDSSYRKIKKNGKTSKECFAQTFECTYCGKTSSENQNFKSLEEIAEWKD